MQKMFPAFDFLDDFGPIDQRESKGLSWALAVCVLLFTQGFSVFAQDMLPQAATANDPGAQESGSQKSAVQEISALHHGMGYYEVMKVWGAPQERLEREVRREVVWVYGPRKVFFQDGKVVAWLGSQSKDSDMESKPLTGSQSGEKNNLAVPGVDSEVSPDRKTAENILGELLQDLGSAGAAETGKNPPPSPTPS